MNRYPGLKRLLRIEGSLSAAIMVVFFACSSAGAVDGGIAQRGDRAPDAAGEIQTLLGVAERGNPEAQHRLDMAYMEGEGVPKDHVAAAKWFRRAADKGHRDAQFQLGVMYRDGLGMPADEAAAKRWLREAADLNHEQAAIDLRKQTMVVTWQILTVIATLAFGPGIFWLWYFYHKDKLEPEPTYLVRKAFFFGMASVVPAGLLEYAAPSGFLNMVIVAPVIEESCKFLAVLMTLYRDPEFDEPMDGVIYAAAAALGFASLENGLYLYQAYMTSEGMFHNIAIIRAFLSVPGHALFSIMWGYALGVVKFSEKQYGRRVMALGLASAMGSHALFNFICNLGPLFTLGMLILMPLMWQTVHRRIDTALQHSPHSPSGMVPIEEATMPPPSDATAVALKGPWYENRALVIVLMFVCFPAGFYALGKNSKYSVPEKVTIVFLWLVSLAVLGYNAK